MHFYSRYKWNISKGNDCPLGIYLLVKKARGGRSPKNLYWHCDVTINYKRLKFHNFEFYMFFIWASLKAVFPPLKNKNSSFYQAESQNADFTQNK